MSRARQLLNLSQAAVSQQVRLLEDMSRQQLFERDRRGLQLTARGERLLAHAQRLLALNDEVWGLMTLPDFKGEIRLGVPHDIVNPFMPPVLKSFYQAWPLIRVSLVCDTTPCLLGATDRGEIDLALTTERDHGAGAEMLVSDELVWVGARGGGRAGCSRYRCRSTIILARFGRPRSRHSPESAETGTRSVRSATWSRS